MEKVTDDDKRKSRDGSGKRKRKRKLDGRAIRDDDDSWKQHIPDHDREFFNEVEEALGKQKQIEPKKEIFNHENRLATQKYEELEEQTRRKLNGK